MIQVHLENPHRGGWGDLRVSERFVTLTARGQDGRSYEFPSEQDAMRYFRRRLRSWQARGYLIGHQNLDLLRAIAADPVNDDLRMVYGDWLQEQEDSRGELIAMQASPADLGRFAESRFVDQERWHFFGCEAQAHLQTRWRLGFATHLDFAFSAEERDPETMRNEIRCVLRNPTSFFVEQISINVPGHSVSSFWWLENRDGEGFFLHEVIEVALQEIRNLLSTDCLQEVTMIYPGASHQQKEIELGQSAPRKVKVRTQTPISENRFSGMMVNPAFIPSSDDREYQQEIERLMRRQAERDQEEERLRREAQIAQAERARPRRRTQPGGWSPQAVQEEEAEKARRREEHAERRALQVQLREEEREEARAEREGEDSGKPGLWQRVRGRLGKKK